MRFARSTAAVFEASFLDQDGKALPAARGFPSVQIKKPDGEKVADGLGQSIGQGKYRFTWFVPEDAEINTPDRTWSIDWFFATVSGHNRDTTEHFSVIDKIEADPDERKWTYITKVGERERIILRLPERPFQIGFQVLDNSNALIASIFDEEAKITSDKVEQIKETDPNRLLGRVPQNGEFAYYYDTEPLNVGEFIIFWKVRDTIVSPMENLLQVIRVPEMNFWRFNPSLRMFLDKFRKRIGAVQAYSDSDLYEYLIRGLGLINAIAPTTNWTLNSIPPRVLSGVAEMVILGASIWALHAQQILEIELSFTHGGQTVTLDYNHDYGGVISSIRDLLSNFIEKGKQDIFRKATGAGIVGVRPKNYRYYQRVYRVPDIQSQASAFNINNLINAVGI